jgi:hypothetical protein
MRRSPQASLFRDNVLPLCICATTEPIKKIRRDLPPPCGIFSSIPHRWLTEMNGPCAASAHFDEARASEIGYEHWGGLKTLQGTSGAFALRS